MHVFNNGNGSDIKLAVFIEDRAGGVCVCVCVCVGGAAA